MHGLCEEDLAHLETASQSFQRCVDSIPSTCLHFLTHGKEPKGDRGMLRECAEYGGIKKVLQRADILTKVKKCEGMLSHALNIFQVRLQLQRPPRRSSDQSLPPLVGEGDSSYSLYAAYSRPCGTLHFYFEWFQLMIDT